MVIAYNKTKEKSYLALTKIKILDEKYKLIHEAIYDVSLDEKESISFENLHWGIQQKFWDDKAVRRIVTQINSISESSTENYATVDRNAATTNINTNKRGSLKVSGSHKVTSSK